MPVIADFESQSFDVNAAYVLAEMLKPKHVQYGPTLQQINECDQLLTDFTKKSKVVKSVAVLINQVKEQFQTVGAFKDIPEDTAEILQRASDIARNGMTEIEHQYAAVSSFQIPKVTRNKIVNAKTEITAHLRNIENDYLDMRQMVLFHQGKGPEFRATKEKLKKVVEDAQVMVEPEEFKFVEI